jgi:arylsulfatase A-like enzyme
MTLHGAAAQEKQPHNVILFVPDGLRALSVTAQSASTMAAIRDRGVNFKNSYSMFPTFSTANAASFATGHYPGDTGDFSNTIYVGYPVKAAYVPSRDRALVQRVVDLLLAQDYVSGLFVDDDLGDFPGALPLSAINLKGRARTPRQGRTDGPRG